MADQSVTQDKKQEEKTNKAESPKAANTDNGVVKGDGPAKKVVPEQVAKAADAPKGADKGADDTASADTYSLQTFLHVHPWAADQLHAFAQWAKTEVEDDLTLAKWEKLLQDFLDRVV